MGFKEWEGLADLVLGVSATSAITLPGGVEVRREERERLRIRRSL
jgi:hypothetical protein